jgi:hypothetical protein
MKRPFPWECAGLDVTDLQGYKRCEKKKGLTVPLQGNDHTQLDRAGTILPAAANYNSQRRMVMSDMKE